MALSNKKRVILSKIETIAGTSVDSTMTAADAVLCSNLTISPLEGSVVERNLIRPYFGSAGSSRNENYVTLSFETELAGGTGVNYTPQWDNLIKSCGFASTISAALTGTTGAPLTGVVGAAQTAGATVVTLASTASTVDNFYTGSTIKVGAQAGLTITAYVGATKTATVNAAVTLLQTSGTTAYEITNGTISNTTTTLKLAYASSKLDDVYVGGTITITTGGAAAEAREIIAYSGSTQTVTLNTALTTTPTSASTYVISAATYYAPTSDIASTSQSSSTFVVNIDGENHVVFGARGSFTLDLTVKQYPMMKWSFTGLLGTFSAATQIIGDFTAWEMPVVVNTGNTTQFSLGGYSPVLSALSIDVGNTVTHRLLIGSESVIISDRKPKGSATIEPTIALLNSYLNAVKTDTAGKLYIRHGAQVGDYVSISGPQVQLGSPKYSEQDSVVMLELSLDFQPLLSAASTGGNNELRIVCK